MEKEYHLSGNPLRDDFRIYVNYVPVKGLALRRTAAAKFCKASKRELSLRREPSNSHDANAIMVMGSSKGWLGRTEKHLGYVPADYAAKLVALNLADLVRARLLKTYVGEDGFVEIEFQIVGPKDLYERFSPRKPRTPFSMDGQGAALARLDALTQFLLKAPVIGRDKIERLRKASFSRTFDIMSEEGKTYGEASGGPEFLNGAEGETQAHLQSIDNDLAAHIEIVETSCRSYFETGEIPAPYYPWRIVIILGKLKEKDRERNFLGAWCKHFPAGNGARYEQLRKRAQKLGAMLL